MTNESGMQDRDLGARSMRVRDLVCGKRSLVSAR